VKLINQTDENKHAGIPFGTMNVCVRRTLYVQYVCVGVLPGNDS